MVVGSAEPGGAETEHFRRAASSVPQISWRAPREVNVLELVKHSLLVVSLDSLAELEAQFFSERTTGHVARIALDEAGAGVAAQAAAS
jgi:hypothetical protein